jgi:NAD(P)-dependent dehydrogenase (short-subunit alcohol dehydrogenase family)
MPQKTLLLAGASRGLGLALAYEFLQRDWRVVATERSRSRLHELAKGSQGRLEVEKLDIAAADDIAGLRARLAARRFDLVFANAGVANGPEEKFTDVSNAEFARMMMTNALGPMRFIEAFVDLATSDAALGVMSSGLGSVERNTTGQWEVYRATKAALNMLMRSYAARPETKGRSFLIITPGWVRTDMGGSNANLSIEESIPRVADVLVAQLEKPGLRFLDYTGAAVPW